MKAFRVRFVDNKTGVTQYTTKPYLFKVFARIACWLALQDQDHREFMQRVGEHFEIVETNAQLSRDFFFHGKGNMLRAGAKK